ncbi:MAG: hypothetical protein EHJ95_07340 [Methanobacteriota archaeon]|nr:MAG: hypothetical protein EHJ95_07340 [Euryarchaeota archaeon]
MSQSRAGSLSEAVTNVAVGYALAVTANLLILPLFGYPVRLHEAASMGAAFTVVSLARSYGIRRWYESRDGR